MVFLSAQTRLRFTDEIENGFQFQLSRLSESMGERQEGG